MASQLLKSPIALIALATLGLPTHLLATEQAPASHAICPPHTSLAKP